MDVTDIQEKMEQVKSKRRTATHLLEQAGKLEAEVRDACPHPATLESKTYYEGSYLDRASTLFRAHCAICGKLLTETSVQYSRYG